MRTTSEYFFRIIFLYVITLFDFRTESAIMLAWICLGLFVILQPVLRKICLVYVNLCMSQCHAPTMGRITVATGDYCYITLVISALCHLPTNVKFRPNPVVCRFFRHYAANAL